MFNEYELNNEWISGVGVETGLGFQRFRFYFLGSDTNIFYRIGEK